MPFYISPEQTNPTSALERAFCIFHLFCSHHRNNEERVVQAKKMEITQSYAQDLESIFAHCKFLNSWDTNCCKLHCNLFAYLMCVLCFSNGDYCTLNYMPLGKTRASTMSLLLALLPHNQRILCSNPVIFSLCLHGRQISISIFISSASYSSY